MNTIQLRYMFPPESAIINVYKTKKDVKLTVRNLFVREYNISGPVFCHCCH